MNHDEGLVKIFDTNKGLSSTTRKSSEDVVKSFNENPINYLAHIICEDKGLPR